MEVVAIPLLLVSSYLPRSLDLQFWGHHSSTSQLGRLVYHIRSIPTTSEALNTDSSPLKPQISRSPPCHITLTHVSARHLISRLEPWYDHLSIARRQCSAYAWPGRNCFLTCGLRNGNPMAQISGRLIFHSTRPSCRAGRRSTTPTGYMTRTRQRSLTPQKGQLTGDMTYLKSISTNIRRAVSARFPTGCMRNLQ